jgi:hypothetical protein
MEDKSVSQVEKNVSASFGYVKKDMLMVNDAISNLHDKIQHLSMNQAMLLEKFVQLEKSLGNKKVSRSDVSNKELEFYDLKKKESFKTTDYKIKTVNGRKFAVAFSPAGNKSFRILGASKKKVKKDTKKKSGKKITKKKISKTPKKVVTETVLYE